jgi:Carboxypeptidase regulatory-like domain
MSFRVRLAALLTAGLLTLQPTYGQTASGSITGRVVDMTKAAIPRVLIEITNEETGLKHSYVTGAEGEYLAPALQAGNYQLVALSPGFQKLLREVIVEAGTSTTADLTMLVGASNSSISVNSATPQMHHDSFEISGVTTRSEIQGTPLNGRNFLELAKLEPGALQPARGSNNRVFVPLLTSPAGGNNGRGTLVTVDGGSVMQIGNGGAAMGFSQEVVQEFQVCLTNCDLATGMTAYGAVNVATRSGGIEWHGSGFYFFRDHYLSAYPALTRDPTNPDPYFQRQQFGIAAGGPVATRRLFIFATVERNDQTGVVSTKLLTPEFAPLSRITPSPSDGDQLSARLDWLVNEKNPVFVRQSHEGGFSFAPTTLLAAGQLAYPSAWTRQPDWADQSLLGWTSQLGANRVNDLRFSYFFVSSAEQDPTDADCPGCLGIGAPSITVADLIIGTSTTTTVLGRRYHLNDAVTSHFGSHNLRFGGDWETTRGGRTDRKDDPVTMNLFTPSEVRNYNALQPPGGRILLPASFLTLPDILNLPLKNFTVGIGNPKVPQSGFGNTRIAPLIHLFAEDNWHIRPSLSLQFGVAWNFDAPLNYDLAKPTYLTPLLGTTGLAATHRNWRNFSPLGGFAWSPGQDRRTVIQGGAGIYYDFQTAFGIADEERVSLGPRGVGRGSYVGAGIANPLNNVPGVPAGTPLGFVKPTQFTGTTLLQALPIIQTYLEQQRGDPTNRDFSVTNIETDKQGSFVDSHLPNASSTQVSVGIQREISHDFVITADFVYRYFAHVSGSFPQKLDLNHFSAARGPLLPLCVTNQQETDPTASCSLGPITSTVGIGEGQYRGLLVRAEKHYSHGWQFLGSYAYSSGTGNGFQTGFNNDDPLANRGPLTNDSRHILAVSGLAQLPLHFQLGYFGTYVSRPPFSAVLSSVDMNGDGTTGDLLPGTTVNQFNRSLGKSDLQRLVGTFNQTYAGKLDARGTLLPLITLPSSYEFGDSVLTQDLRLSRNMKVRDRLTIMLIGEVFNVFNISNLSGYSNSLIGAGFGQPKSRVTQVFGSGGPRALQFGTRIDF